ncbi:hypothetical protein BJ138DRAFT_681025 [Hygrophoropsis aurantiaca]|uniref:Uncharacterized protein n=1 Tax=Hygrophoropsis aurantiaca TaxID=72124 RepID=A0ACB7ZZD0_9AGAM|nr:hypothetical protein BJ138DRAFT_681025 [Hygrophoropsis aurantiaca]
MDIDVEYIGRIQDPIPRGGQYLTLSLYFWQVDSAEQRDGVRTIILVHCQILLQKGRIRAKIATQDPPGKVVRQSGCSFFREGRIRIRSPHLTLTRCPYVERQVKKGTGQRTRTVPRIRDPKPCQSGCKPCHCQRIFRFRPRFRPSVGVILFVLSCLFGSFSFSFPPPLVLRSCCR